MVRAGQSAAAQGATPRCLNHCILIAGRTPLHCWDFPLELLRGCFICNRIALFIAKTTLQTPSASRLALPYYCLAFTLLPCLYHIPLPCLYLIALPCLYLIALPCLARASRGGMSRQQRQRGGTNGGVPNELVVGSAKPDGRTTREPGERSRMFCSSYSSLCLRHTLRRCCFRDHSGILARLALSRVCDIWCLF